MPGLERRAKKRQGRIAVDIHEYQTKEILARFGVLSPKGGLAYSPEQAAYHAHELGGNKWVVKAQIHSGGRGKAGGVKICDSESAVFDAANDLFGQRLVTEQTGPAGKVVYRVYVEEALEIRRELYLALVLDRVSERIMVIASAEGGMEIEEIAAHQPASMVHATIDPAVGLPDFQAREIAFALKFAPSQIQDLIRIVRGCYRAFRDMDATMLEINPLGELTDGSIVALDAKLAFDDNALYRRPEISELRDKTQEDTREKQAADRGLNYVGLDGNIGCMVNGAGLAMATMDMIQLAGGQPANFLDIGGGASPDRVAKAFRLVRSDQKVEAVLVNIFAGINRCDWVAEGVVQALEAAPIDIPVVVRLAGTNVKEGRQILSRSGLPIIRAGTLAEASDRVVSAWKTQKAQAGSPEGAL